ncbi:hypothetical protein EIN_403370 [Entamoeba invadens IP1]|uniref:Uncharacterized protein n=1 Tax=Entamoeba invadens IP1 TaxID=370355 RepID=A0A0A1U6G9_ENTIV|nr:hypothetical protein EIN_403370 [Entamoeba invadens IP1]ELP90013.1 hypothetical protein EIN_403370 [Entamoeba invadens IP1]|eukprot:XP_004256784.1 hypothetical protein EIN_403370 [Entamoeba invadens IP1]
MFSLGGFGGLGGLEVISPLDACRGSTCRRQVKSIMDKAEALENSLKKIDETERALIKENEGDLEDMTMFASHDETQALRAKIRSQNENLRKVRQTRRTLMRTLYKLVSKLSLKQQGRLIRYMNLEHRIKVNYADFSKYEKLPRKFKTCNAKEGIDPIVGPVHKKKLLKRIKSGLKKGFKLKHVIKLGKKIHKKLTKD